LNLAQLSHESFGDVVQRRETCQVLATVVGVALGQPLGHLQQPLVGVTPGAERLLSSAGWEGNIRELRNVLERACILADGDFITERELMVSLPVWTPAAPAAPEPVRAPRVPPERLADVERDHIQRALERASGNKKAAAKMLGLSRRALYRRLERLDLSNTITRRANGALLVEA